MMNEFTQVAGWIVITSLSGAGFCIVAIVLIESFERVFLSAIRRASEDKVRDSVADRLTVTALFFSEDLPTSKLLNVLADRFRRGSWVGDEAAREAWRRDREQQKELNQ